MSKSSLRWFDHVFSFISIFQNYYLWVGEIAQQVEACFVCVRPGFEAQQPTFSPQALLEVTLNTRLGMAPSPKDKTSKQMNLLSEHIVLQM